MATAATAIQTDIVAALRVAYSEYLPAEKKGLTFGQRLYELRAGSEVVQGGTTFAASLDAASIPRRTAYYWMTNYEVFIGVRQEKVAPVKPAAKPVKIASVVQAEHVTSRDEMPYRTEPLAPFLVPAKRPWTPADEKRKNRSEPLASEAAVIRLALGVIDAGQKVLKGTVDASQLHAAVTLAKLRVQGDL
jgi:hypothetical protein